MNSKDISVIIISWNALHFLRKCISSLYDKNVNCNFEVILIDNNSTDGTEEFIRENYPHITYIKNSTNRGVGPTRNQGMRIASGDYILILDVDTEFITEDSLKELKEYMDNNPDIGLIGARLLSKNGEVQKSALKFPSIWIKMFVRFEKFPLIGNLKMFKEYYLLDRDLSSPQDVDYVIGAFQFIRKSAIDNIGLYDENIFYGPEDIDFCLRLKQNGYRVVYYPYVKLHHFYQRITRKLFSMITFRHFLGLLHFFWKHKYINYPDIRKNT